MNSRIPANSGGFMNLPHFVTRTSYLVNRISNHSMHLGVVYIEGPRSPPWEKINERVRLMADPLAGYDEDCLLHQHHGFDGGELPAVLTGSRQSVHVDARRQILTIG
jgi:hypothetical protein